MPSRTVTTTNDRDDRGRFISRPPTLEPNPPSADLEHALIDADAEQWTARMHHRVAQAQVLLAAVASGSFGLHPDAAAILADQDGGS